VHCVQIAFKGPPVCCVAAGSEFSAIADVVGNLYTFGNPEYGQLGTASLVILLATTHDSFSGTAGLSNFRRN